MIRPPSNCNFPSLSRFIGHKRSDVKPNDSAFRTADFKWHTIAPVERETAQDRNQRHGNARQRGTFKVYCVSDRQMRLHPHLHVLDRDACTNTLEFTPSLGVEGVQTKPGVCYPALLHKNRARGCGISLPITSSRCQAHSDSRIGNPRSNGRASNVACKSGSDDRLLVGLAVSYLS